ncbi:PREDICTED: transmembrane emp24 domain-containing protein p24delta5 [Camelina sativa]|uniref:Transmembrane emp24 domain-containing protein p24delta5 n=1 Tax=Camelina sativa TaxID=90675 RepID=A0ABM0YBS5_CAMSA|nr:PREDICTED: transmembrane emp24 domain-containing protein p24delta5 [Camelina sativa]
MAISRIAQASWILTVVLLLLTVNYGEAVWLTIPASGGTKCVSEEIQSNVVVLADYYIVDEHNPEHTPAVSSKVTSPYGNNLHHQENVTHGQFAFTTQEAGNYLACFWVDASLKLANPLTLGVDWKMGIAAKDWDSVAKKEKIEGVELQLRRLEGLVQAIRENINYIKDREAEMREVSEKTNSRVAWFSIMSLGVCVVVAGTQILYLKRYFHKKKLI